MRIFEIILFSILRYLGIFGYFLRNLKMSTKSFSNLYMLLIIILAILINLVFKLWSIISLHDVGLVLGTLFKLERSFMERLSVLGRIQRNAI